MLKHFICTSLIFLFPSLAGAGTISGSVAEHSFSLPVSCEFLPNGWIKVRTLDPGLSQKDTSGDGYFLEISGPGIVLASVFHAKQDVFQFGLSNVDVSESGFEAAETMQRSDGSEYGVRLTASC